MTEPYVPIDDEKAREIAEGLFRGTLFCDRQIRPADANLLHQIFMPLIFMDPQQIDQMKRNGIGFLYARMSTAGPQSINGYPVFGEVSALSTDDGRRVITLYEAMQSAVESVGTPEKKEGVKR
jgi:hypothetical protein